MDAEAPLDERYFTWLYGKVADAETKDPSLSWWRLLRQFYTTEFVWIHHDDENRLEDGKELRNDFIRETGAIGVDPEWASMGCSVLELMIGLAKHLAFLGDGELPFWFWHLMDNLGVRRYTDDRRYPESHVTDVIDRVIQRKYDVNGEGGFFPLRDPHGNQRGSSLWQQLNDYVVEQYDM